MRPAFHITPTFISLQIIVRYFHRWFEIWFVFICDDYFRPLLKEKVTVRIADHCFRTISATVEDFLNEENLKALTKFQCLSFDRHFKRAAARD